MLARLLLAAAVLAVTAVPAAAAPEPSVAPCALGTADRDLRGFYSAELARAERRFAARAPHERRTFAAGVAAYVYGLAPVAVNATVQRFPANQLVSIAALVDPSVRTVVLPNVDTTYTVGQLRLDDGPLILEVPDTAGRYYVIQLLDAYSNTFAYVGRRTTGTRAGTYAITPPGYDGPLPPGVRRIRSPTNLVWTLGRTLVSGAGDLPTVAALMRGYRITPLSDWSTGTRQLPLVLPAFPSSPPVPRPRGLAFYTALSDVLRTDPAPARDACALRAFRRVLSGGASRRALLAAERAALRIVARAERRANRLSAARNRGWLVAGRYIGAYGRNYLGRALIALGALGANTRPETLYPLALTDVRGRRLTGRHRYRIRFPRGELPPADAFWSLTAYGPDRYLVPNPIGRYAIGDRTPGLRRGADGSLTIHVQRRPPAEAARANWLPAPAGRFRLAMRIYEPRRSALSGAWKPPPIRRR